MIKSKRNICHIITTIDLGGAEKQLLELASTQRLQGAKVKIIYLKGTPALQPEFENIGIEVDSTFAKYNLFRQILKMRFTNFPDGTIFHAHLPRAELLCSLSLQKRSFVSTRHNSERFWPGAPRIFSELLSKFSIRKSFAIIAISDAVRVFLLKNNEVSKNCKLVTVHYGIKNISDKKSKKSANKGASLTIGTIARLVPQKNIPILLKAAHILKNELDLDFKLLIVGIGPLKEELEFLARDLQVDEVVFWLGKLHDVNSFYELIDCFVLTSNYEGFGLVLLEAMLNRVPIIARDNSAIREVLGANHPGISNSMEGNSFAQTIFRMLHDESFRDLALNLQSRQLLKFDIKYCWLKHEALYDLMGN
jgi:glycosyltransferase involved in cell wall biosynthesis